MRSDMKEVLLTRPRRGGGNISQPGWNNGVGSRLRGHAQDLEDYEVDLPKHEGRCKRYGWDTKQMSWYHNPLYRALVKNVGRPWDDVYSELCSLLSGKVGYLLRDRTHGAVEQHVQMRDDKPYTLKGYPILGYRGFHQTYVHPDTGILCVAPQREPYNYNHYAQKRALEERELEQALGPEAQWHLV